MDPGQILHFKEHKVVGWKPRGVHRMGGARATEAEANQERWVGSEAVPLCLQDDFHRGAGEATWRVWGYKEGLCQGPMGMGWGEWGGLAFSTGGGPEPWLRMWELCTGQWGGCGVVWKEITRNHIGRGA